MIKINVMDEKEINWEQRRYEIAKECVAALIRDEITLEDAVKISVEQADELIKELKESMESKCWISVNERKPDISDVGISDNVLLKVYVYNKKHKNTYECCIEAFYDSDIDIWEFMLPISKRNLEITPKEWRSIK